VSEPLHSGHREEAKALGAIFDDASSGGLTKLTKESSGEGGFFSNPPDGALTKLTEGACVSFDVVYFFRTGAAR
jgi:hypothetical protein